MTLDANCRRSWVAAYALMGAIALASCGGGGGSGASGDTASTGSNGAVGVAAAPGNLAWSTPSASWAASGAAAVATVTRSGGSDGTVTVAYSTRDGTALAGRNYTAASGTLTWGDKDSAPKSVAVLLAHNAKSTAPLAMTLALSGATGGASFPAGGAEMSLNLEPGWTVPATLPQFDLSKWRLDLPVDANGGTGGAGGQQLPADAILPSELSTTYVSPYFYSDAQGRVVFTAPANGAVTTPGVGSNHTRSELHEVFSGPGATPNGDWTGNGVLTATCTVQAVAAGSDAAIIGQLRGDNNDLALLMYRPSHRDVAIDVYQANLSGSTHVRTPIATNVNLGDTIAYRLALQGGVLTATVNGHTQSSSIRASWAGVPPYFKLGAYHTAPNTGNAANDLTMVIFSSFSVQH
jgi:hypothetical protein